MKYSFMSNFARYSKQFLFFRVCCTEQIFLSRTREVTKRVVLLYGEIGDRLFSCWS